MAEIRLMDLPKIPASRFRYENSTEYNRHAGYFECVGHARWKLADEMNRRDERCELIGWCPLRNGTRNAIGRDSSEYILVMVHSSYHDGEVWQHLPVRKEFRAETVFIVSDEAVKETN